MKTDYFRSLLVLILLSVPIFLFASPIGKITWTKSFLDPSEETLSNRLKFGYISVPEDYSKPEGRILKIAFVVIRAYIADKSPSDASIYFMGGWGSRSIKSLSYYEEHFLSYKRDLILYDYRGSGYSEPKLCDELGTGVFDNVLANLSSSEFETRQKALFDTCLDDLESQGFDINQYGTDNKGRDGVLLAKALGYESYNLFGVSYGTKTILQFIRQSNVKIRSVILDSNCPLDYPINSAMTEDYVKSLDKILGDCEDNPDCNQKYPHLREKLINFLNSLDEKPIKIKLPQSRIAYLNKPEINGIIHQLLYDERNYGLMPFLLNKFIKRNKYIIQRILSNLEDVLLANYNGLGLINYVYDHKPFQEKAIELSESSNKAYAAFQVFDGYQAYFLQDRRFHIELKTTQAIHTDIPTLIMAGKYDPVTPVYYSKMLLPYFSNHYFIEFPKTGHGVSNNWCGESIAEEFLNSFQSPFASSCFDDLQNQSIIFER